MISLQAMIQTCQNLLNWRGVLTADILGYYVNQDRNYVMTDTKNKKVYFLKWEQAEFKTAGLVVPELGPGPGRTVSLKMYKMLIKPNKATTLFGLGGNDGIVKYIDFDEFERMGEDYQQGSGEWVRVVSSKTLKDWGGLRRGI